MEQTETQKTQILKCACCAGYTVGRQFHNQDAGWGLCDDCVTRIGTRKGFNQDEFEKTYGKPGFNYSIVKKEPKLCKN